VEPVTPAKLGKGASQDEPLQLVGVGQEHEHERPAAKEQLGWESRHVRHQLAPNDIRMNGVSVSAKPRVTEKCGLWTLKLVE
jgi:hypothetical protein